MNRHYARATRFLCPLVGLIVLLTGSFGPLCSRAQAVSETTQKMEQAGQSALSSIETIWKRIDETRLRNRTFDELVGWAIMGVLVGGVLSKLTGLRLVTGLALGLVGAFVGGIIVHVTSLDFGMGPVLIRYEDLLFAFAGGFVLVLFVRWLGSRKKKAA